MIGLQSFEKVTLSNNFNNMFCKNCGKQINENVKFCAFCGTEIGATTIKGKPETIIKCGNCSYIGPGEKNRSLVAQILAWTAVFFAPLITIIYFLATSKFRCPKCHSTFVGVQNKKGDFVGQRGGSSRLILIIIIILVGVAIVGILSSVVLASLNSARLKSRDAKRVSDIKQIQLALELYLDSYSNYPASLDALNTNLFSVPKDPQGGSYNYVTCGPKSYHLGVSLEESSNPVLSNDDDKSLLCIDDNISGFDAGKCSPSDSGNYCYDAVNF